MAPWSSLKYSLYWSVPSKNSAKSSFRDHHQLPLYVLLNLVHAISTANLILGNIRSRSDSNLDCSWPVVRHKPGWCKKKSFRSFRIQQSHIGVSLPNEQPYWRVPVPAVKPPLIMAEHVVDRPHMSRKYTKTSSLRKSVFTHMPGTPFCKMLFTYASRMHILLAAFDKRLWCFVDSSFRLHITNPMTL